MSSEEKHQEIEVLQGIIKETREWSDPDKCLQDMFLKLKPGSYRIIGDFDQSFNCIGFADGSRKFICLEETLDAFEKHFSEEGFVICKGEDPNPRVKMVAVYERDGKACHVALREAGEWKSKISVGTTIIHMLDDLEGDGREEYGRIALYMKKPNEG